MTIKPTTPKMPKVFAFLLGEGELDGVSYGLTPIGKPRHWWRTQLRAALEVAHLDIERLMKTCTDETNRAERAEAEAAAMRKALQLYRDARLMRRWRGQ
jgi:hypothetical protein